MRTILLACYLSLLPCLAFAGGSSSGNQIIIDSANNNIAAPPGSLGAVTTGQNNSVYGFSSGTGITTGSGNSIVGNLEFRLFTGSNNTLIGDQADVVLPDASSSVVIGGGARGGSLDTAVGALALHATTTNFLANSAFGDLSLQTVTTGGNNSAFGKQSGFALLDGQNNEFFGELAGASVTHGSNNVVIGQAVGSTTLTIGSNNILIGTTSAIDVTTSAQSNYINIGGTYQGYDTTHTALVGAGALATTATSGFIEIPTSAGAPTGVPISHTGFAPMDYDTTNHKIWFYDGGWKGVVVN